MLPAAWSMRWAKRFGCAIKNTGSSFCGSHALYAAGCPRIRIHCAYEYTYWNVRMTRQLIKSRVPINVIGGIGDAIRGKQLFDFIRGAIAARAIGAGIYDVATTRRDFWRGLRLLNALGK